MPEDSVPLDDYELRVRAESGDSTDSYRYAMHLKNKGALSGGVHGAEYWFRRARDQGHLWAATELELVKTENVEALRAIKDAKENQNVNGAPDLDHPDFLKDPNRRGEDVTPSDLWIKQNAELASEEWLTEIIDRTEFVKKSLRKSIDKRFELELIADVVLSVGMFGNIVIGHLESSRLFIEVKYDLVSLETTKPITSSYERLALGLALSWFIDLSIVIKSVRTINDIFTIRPVGKGSTNSNKKNVGIRYVPTPRFHTAQRAIGSSRGVKKVLHSVSGHIRTLGYGKMPSDDARDRAPKYLRSHMTRNETYVRSHSRGEDKDRREYELRLSKFSASAHALAELNE